MTDEPSQTSKIRHLDIEGGEASPSTEMRCSLPPHRQTLSFTSYEDYEIHYNKTHVNRCLECRKNFPTDHFLNLHIEENHDALMGVRKDRGEKIYACFVEDCDRKCSTPQKRRMHLIDKHLFPKYYDFQVVNTGIDRRSSMLSSGRHRRRNSAVQHMAAMEGRARRPSGTVGGIGALDPKPKDSSEVRGGKRNSAESGSPRLPAPSEKDTDIGDLSAAMSALKFVPPSVRFGRGRGRGRGFSGV